jgi:ribosomal protein S7
MPRKGPAPKRPLVNDPVYGSQLVTQLVNKVLMAGRNPSPSALSMQRLNRPATRPAPTR